MSAEGNGPLGLLLSDDLMFTSRITATARQLGLEIRAAKGQAGLEGLAEREAPRTVSIEVVPKGTSIFRRR